MLHFLADAIDEAAGTRPQQRYHSCSAGHMRACCQTVHCLFEVQGRHQSCNSEVFVLVPHMHLVKQILSCMALSQVLSVLRPCLTRKLNHSHLQAFECHQC